MNRIVAAGVMGVFLVYAPVAFALDKTPADGVKEPAKVETKAEKSDEAKPDKSVEAVKGKTAPVDAAGTKHKAASGHKTAKPVEAKPSVTSKGAASAPKAN